MIRMHSTPVALVALFSLFGALLYPFISRVQAANFQQAYVRFDRMATSQAITGMVCANPATTSAVNVDVQVTFPDENSTTDFTVSGTAGNWAAVTTDIPTGAVAWPGITTATATVASQTVTWTYSGNQTLTAGNLYCFRWTNTAALTTPASSGTSLVGTITTRTTAGVTIDTSKYATAIVGTNADQIVVSAAVPATFTYALSGNTDSFTTNLGTSTVSTSGRTLSISTNAASGWIAWVRSANAALNSSGTGASIATAGSIDATPTDLTGTTGYVLDVDATTQGAGGTGNFTIEPEYDGSNTTSGGTLSTTFQPIAVSDNPAGPTDGDVLTLIERARISAVQPAANDYTDTLTVVAAGRF